MPLFVPVRPRARTGYGAISTSKTALLLLGRAAFRISIVLGILLSADGYY